MDSCLFCRIIKGEIPADIIYRDEQVIAFSDIDPKAPHHYLIIPVRHVATALDVQDEDAALIGHIHLVAARIAKEKGFAEKGYRVVNNCNSDGGQIIWHLHFHLLAGRQMTWPPG